jgi:tight adherence protein B
VLSAFGCAAAVFAAAAIARWMSRAPARPTVPPGVTRGPPAYPWRHRGAPIGAALDQRRRRRALTLAWPAVADELAATLRTGSSLRQALGSVASREDDVGEVLRELLGPVDRGQALTDAAAGWGKRAQSPDEGLLAEAVQLAAVTGRPEPLLFDTVADSVRERLALAGELRAQTAQARTSALVLAALPAGFTVLVATNDSRASHFLFGTAPGWACTALGLTLDAVGFWWMHTAIRSAVP